eukprot:2845752-Rhodomonas_salina.2
MRSQLCTEGQRRRAIAAPTISARTVPKRRVSNPNLELAGTAEPGTLRWKSEYDGSATWVDGIFRDSDVLVSTGSTPAIIR